MRDSSPSAAAITCLKRSRLQMRLAAILGLVWIVPSAVTVVGLPMAWAFGRSSIDLFRSASAIGRASATRATSDLTAAMEHAAAAFRRYAAISVMSVLVVPIAMFVLAIGLIGVMSM